jgi:thioredoxin reductase (NADPH)
MSRHHQSRFGAEILLGREGVRGEFVPGKGVGHLADGTKIVAKSTICATGIEYRGGSPNPWEDPQCPRTFKR